MESFAHGKFETFVCTLFELGGAILMYSKLFMAQLFQILTGERLSHEGEQCEKIELEQFYKAELN